MRSEANECLVTYSLVIGPPAHAHPLPIRTASSPSPLRCCPFIHESLTLSNTAGLFVILSRLNLSDSSVT